MRAKAAPALVCLSIAALLATSEALADDKDAKKDAPAANKAEEASQRFKSGVAFYKDRDFTAAMVEFKRAYELLPNYNVLFNLGQTARELKDYAAALTAFERYLREGGAKVAPARRKDVQSSIDELAKKVGKLKVVANVEGAEISIDDTPVGVSPLAEPVVVNIGRRKLSATSSGYVPVQRVVEVAGMADATVSLELTKVEAAPPPPPPTEPPKDAPEPPKPGVPVVAWVTLSATGATAIVAGVMGGLALSARGSLKTALATFPGDPKAITDAQSRTRTFAVAADVLGGVTVAGAITTAILFVVAPRSSAKPTTSLEISPTGVALRGVF